MVGNASKNGHKKNMCLKDIRLDVTHSKPKNQHNWKDPYDHLNEHKILHFDNVSNIH